MLAKTPKGNLTAGFSELAAKAEAVINDRAFRQGPINSEVAVSSAEWFLVRTYPGNDALALRGLARRRFGAFRPMQQRHDKLSGIALQGWEAAFPGWIFVLAWDIDKMRARIVSCPGVMGLLCDPASSRPVPIDEEFIDRVRALSWVYNENAPHSRTQPGMRALRNVKRLRRAKIDKRTRKTLQKLKNGLRARGRWDSSTWESANMLAPHERIALLQRTLNAPSLEA